jgi:UDP-N-acetylmuramate--alanine ligase
LVSKQGLDLKAPQAIQTIEYGAPQSTCRAENIRVIDGQFTFDYVSPQTTIKAVTMQVPGFHNIENAVAAITIALHQNVQAEQIKEALLNFKGVKRRFEYVVKNQDLVYIDDYAHHPAELEALLSSAKALYPNKKITCIFQPHLFTRTRDFANEFAQSLSLANEVILLDIYPARELPIPGVTSDIIFQNIQSESKKRCTTNTLLNVLSESKLEVVITAGAGDIDRCVPLIKDFLSNGKKEPGGTNQYNAAVQLENQANI